MYVHGFITVSGDKMSKSRGTGIDPLRYLSLGMNPEWLRYYIAAKLNANVEDLDFNPDDFLTRVNSDLVGKYINIASRCAPFLTRRFGGRLAAHAGGTRATILEHGTQIAADYEAREFGKALKSVMALADLANQYVDQAQALGTRQVGIQRARAAPRMFERAQHVPFADNLFEAGSANSGTGS